MPFARGLIPDPALDRVRDAERAERRLQRRPVALDARTDERNLLRAGATPDQVTTLVTTSTGLSQRRTHEVLMGAPPTSDAGLVRLADDLDLI